jgi:DNA repair protein RadC
MERYLLAPRYRASLVRETGEKVEWAKTVRTVRQAAEAAQVARACWPDSGVEVFGVLMLDVRKQLCGVGVVSPGCLTSSLVHPREVFRYAIVGLAAALILVHNHPSGDPEPSAEDIALTRRIAAGGALLGIEVLDHIILGDGGDRFVSLKDRGVL